ncbi:MAG TPA: ATP-binding protein [Candidatus Eisenbacteria bacterium]
MPNRAALPTWYDTPEDPDAPLLPMRRRRALVFLLTVIVGFSWLELTAEGNIHYLQFLILVPALAALLTTPATTAFLAVTAMIATLAVGVVGGISLTTFYVPAAVSILAAGVVGTFTANAQREILLENHRREMEHRRALRESLSLLQATLESTADGILVVDLQQRVTSFNARFAEIWGLSDELLSRRKDEELIEAVLSQLVDPEAFLMRVRELYDRPSEESFDTLQFKDGRVMERYSKPQMIDTRIVGRVWSFRDVTRAREAEAERARLRDTLARSESMSAIGELVGGVAHEVRNPLFTISASVDTFEAKFGHRPEFRPYTSALRGSVERLSRLMGQLLDYGRPQQTAPVPMSLAECVQLAIDLLPLRGGDHGIRIENRVPADLPAITIDRYQVLQVFQNLIENAVQASSDGGTVVITGFRLELEGHDGCECSVDDSGPGFNPGPIGRIFQPFISERAGGTGLGLSIVQRIVEQNGGRVVAGNRPEGGASVRVWFPAATPSPIDSHALEKGTHAGTPDPTRR